MISGLKFFSKKLMLLTLVIVFTGLLFVTAYAAPTQENLQQLFTKLDNRNGGNWYKDYNNENGVLAWDESYVMHAYLEMYEATGETKYLDKFVVHANSVLKQRDSERKVKDYRGLSLPAWSAGNRYTKNGTLKIFEVHTGMIAYPFARFATIVNHNSSLVKYKQNADVYLKAAKDAVAVHDSQWVQTETEMYMNRPFNMFLALGQAFLEIYQASGDTAYRDKAVKIARHFKNNLNLDSAANSYYWKYMRSGSYTGLEDLSHGAIDTEFAYLSYKNGVIFTETDMQRFGNTVQKKLLKSDGSIADKVNGSGTSSNQSFIGLYLPFYSWAPSLFDRAFQKVSAVSAAQGEDLLSAGFLNKVWAEKNGPVNPVPEPTPEPDPTPEPEPTPEPVPTDNFVKNGDFSNGTMGWSGPKVTVKSESNGNKYGLNTYNWDYFQDLSLKPGEYRLACQTRKGTSTTQARVVVVFIDSSGKRTVGHANTYKHQGSGWESMPDLIVKVPQTASITRVYLLTNGGSGYHDFDNISVRSNSVSNNKDTMIANGDFSGGTTSWSGSQARVKQEANGNKYAYNDYNWNFFQDLKLIPGQYQLSAQTRKGTSTTQARIVVLFIDGTGKRTVGNDFTYRHQGSGWENMPKMKITVPSSAVTTRIYLLTNGGKGYHDFDNLRLEQL